MQKFFVADNQIDKESNKIIIESEDVNHIKNVLRYKSGQQIEVANKQKAETYLCKIDKVLDKSVECDILRKVEESKESSVYIHILQGLPKADKMELIIQKCTELGVKEITPVVMSRCVVKLDEKEKNKKVERWQKIAEVAAKQCAREIIPKINFVHDLKNVCELLEKYDIVLITYEKEESKTLKQAINELKNTQKQDLKIAILIGPEGGIDEKELSMLPQAHVITLGKRILRTETVALTVSSILMYELRRLRINKI